MTYLSNLSPQTKLHSAVINNAILSHGSSCSCGCDNLKKIKEKKQKKKPLANNRKYAANHENQGLQDFVKRDVNQHPDKYHTNIDGFALAGAVKKAIYLDSYFLSNIVAQMEANTDFFPKGTNKVVAGNCGKRVMSERLREKIYGKRSTSSRLAELQNPKDDFAIDYKNSTVDIIDYNGSVSFSGVMCCHDIWGCPVCARKISELRRQGLANLLTAHFARFGSGTVTASLLTIPHGLGDDLVDIKERFLKAYRQMTSSRAYRDLIKSLEYCGLSRALEATFSLLNGFHPHLHILHFFEKELSSEELNRFSKKLFELWTKALLKIKFKTPDRRGFGCQLVASDKKTIADVAEYFSKIESDVSDSDIQSYLKSDKNQNVRSVTNAQGQEITGWSTEHEMTKWHLKKAKQSGENYRYSMFDFIRGYYIAKVNGDEETAARFRALWLSYRAAFKGSRQLVTKHKHFKISELESTDEELGEQAPKDNQAKIVYQIPFEIWLLVVYMGARGLVLESARIGGAEKVEKTLKIIRQGYNCLPTDRQVLMLTG